MGKDSEYFIGIHTPGLNDVVHRNTRDIGRLFSLYNREVLRLPDSRSPFRFDAVDTFPAISYVQKSHTDDLVGIGVLQDFGEGDMEITAMYLDRFARGSNLSMEMVLRLRDYAYTLSARTLKVFFGATENKRLIPAFERHGFTLKPGSQSEVIYQFS